ncbi:MAG: SpoIIIAH-like family protein [Lachnospiraceae bacterium]|nr:SpoIIIAH-like family protein [Lachnospiraceae bacterium]MBD5455382.1 SpoIIIAH-like family protein [Lachnospiraceae bacterium]
MKNMVKKNQIMITALAIMIAVAGYLNFAGTRITDENIMETGADSAVISGEMSTITDDTDVAALFEISDEDMEQAERYDIESMDTEIITEQENYLEETMEEVMAEMSKEQISETETPGEAVFTSAASLDTLSGAKLAKEQVRAKNKETLLDIINNVNISEEQKQEAIDGMIALTDIAEKETAAEILLEAKGFDDVVVSIADGMVDVVVNTSELTEAQRAQIEDIIVRKTGISAENIVISTTT